MTNQEKAAAINSLCLSSQFSTLHRILNELPGSLSILSSDRTAEQKRQELLKLLKAEA
jgi:hypothetical protein